MSARLLALLAPALLLSAPGDGLQPIDLRSFGQVVAAEHAELGPAGLELDIDRAADLVLAAPGAQGLEVTVRSSADLTLLYAVVLGTEVQRTSLVRTVPIPPGPSTLFMDMRTIGGWHPLGQPLLHFTGTGHLTIEAMRASPAPPRERAYQALDEGRRWAVQPINHSTINTLEPLVWSASRQTYFAELAGLGFLAAAALLAALGRLRRRWTPRRAVAWAALGAAGGFGLLALARMAPVASLMPRPGVEARLAEDLPIEQRLGLLAARARQVLPEADRVGVVADGDWYAFELLCYHLAPRRCVRYQPGQEAHEGFYGIDRLATDDLDALVFASSGEPVPPGFTPVSTLTRRDLIARRVR